ncbi:MAG: type II toxin-antitoxin system VapC family toxin, partial [Bacteroidia bacterium]
MKHLFLDTNVLIDFLSDRKPFSDDAAILFNYSLNKEIKIYVSAVSYNNICYIIRKSLTHQSTIRILNELQELTECIDVSNEVIKNSLNSDFKDFEDAIQYNSAKSESKIDFIVTRNSKDFKLSSIPVISPKEA